MTRSGTARRPDGTVGFLCDCGGNTTVKDSRPVPFGMIRRRRKCNVCHQRFSTFEVKAERYAQASGMEGLDVLLNRVTNIARDIHYLQDWLLSAHEVADKIMAEK